MATAAWQVAVKVTGAAVAVTAEATTFLTGKRYQVTNAARRILDPSAAITVKDNGVAVAAANILAIEHLFGIVEFVSGYTVTGPVTLDASYLPTYSVAECNSISTSISRELVDSSVFESQWRKKTPGLLDFSGTLKSLQIQTVDIDTVTGGTQSVDGWLKAGTHRVLDILFATGARLRAWVLFGEHSPAAELAGVVTVDVAFQGSSPAAGAAVAAVGS